MEDYPILELGFACAILAAISALAALNSLRLRITELELTQAHLHCLIDQGADQQTTMQFSIDRLYRVTDHQNGHIRKLIRRVKLAEQRESVKLAEALDKGIE